MSVTQDTDLEDKKSSLSVVMELENAKSLREKEDLLQSVHSVVESMKKLNARYETPLELVFSGQKDQCDSLVRELEGSNWNVKPLKIGSFDNSDHGYFAAKLRAAALTNSDVLIFCDSDCIYEVSYMTKMFESIQANPEAVVYGRTFAMSPRTRLEGYSSLAWLFPPEHIGYGLSWPRSTWANSMGMRRDILKNTPFPEVSVRGLSGMEVKQERPIWSKRLASLGHREIEIDATAYHVQFSSFGDWFRRQFTHGVGSSLKERLPMSRFITNARRRPQRVSQLRQLLKDGQISRRDFWGARGFIILSLLAQALGVIFVKLFGLKMQVAWPQPDWNSGSLTPLP